MIGFNSNRAGEEHNNLPPQNNSNNTDPIPNPPPQPVIRYGECLKNHAANVGRHVTDGCGEFMPSGEEPLKCAACDCHRSFHRKETEGSAVPPSANTATAPYYPYNLAHGTTIGHLVQHPPPPPPAPTTTAPQHRYGRAGGAPVMMTFGGGAAAESSSEEMAMLRINHDGGGQSASRKRFRTKFTLEQKARMREFAERIGWKIQKQNEAEVQQFCAEAGVKRQVFKVWMHNCNQASKRKQS